MFKCLLKGHNYWKDDKYFPKYVKCSYCGHKRFYKGRTIEEKFDKKIYS